ncbi:MAG TPA: sensor domain-containing phosphodiesterase [Ideonella sp.]|nr:sensor domain-containing phosphodiesterase [Ideonella sp.]
MSTPAAPRRRWGLSIRAAVMAAILAGVVLPGLFMLWADPLLSRASYQSLVDHRRDTVLALTAGALAEPLQEQNAEGLRQALKLTLLDPQVCSIAIAGPTPAPKEVEVNTRRCPASVALVMREAPIQRGGQPMATLQLGFDGREVAQLLGNRRDALLRLVAVQGVFGAAVLMLVLTWRLLRPIDRLKAQASSLATPNATAAGPVDWRRDDELGQLGQHLNLASERIASLVGQLEISNTELRRIAMYDQLTGLPNRRLFRELFERALATAKRSQRPMALLFIDLDRFKQINDTWGHRAGDELLLQVSHRLRETVRDSDLVGRLSGDEFLALLPEADHFDAIAHSALRLIQAVEVPLTLSGPLEGGAAGQGHAQISASIGVARYPRDGEDFDELLRRADQAMYRAKALGRGRYAIYRDGQNGADDAFGLDDELGQALVRGELQMHFQPVMDTRSGCAVGVEALMRWQHPREGLLAPARFIRRAEESGHLHALSLRALSGACAQLARWKDAGHHPGSVAVNVSAGQFFHPEWPQALARVIAQHHVEPGELAVELTEGTLMADGDAEGTLERVAALRRLGVKLVVDDFGAGLVSLSRLSRLRPDVLKIDPGFVQLLPGDADTRALIAGIVQLARSLGAEVVGEGVETEAQRDALAELGCVRQQGYLFAAPQVALTEPSWPSAPHVPPPAAASPAYNPAWPSAPSSRRSAA